jgi:uncharacterized protein
MNPVQIARASIESYLNFSRFEPDEKTKRKYGKKGACFVIIKKNGKLRGCIGTINPFQSLYKDIITNSVNACFRDYRFNPLEKEELNKITIEVLVLSSLKKINFSNHLMVKLYLRKKFGVVIKKGPRSATFLPELWERFPETEKFLNNLGLKAGLRKDDWKTSDIYYYTTKSFKEKNV